MSYLIKEWNADFKGYSARLTDEAGIIADKNYFGFKRMIVHASMNDKNVIILKSFRHAGIKIRF